MSNDRPSWSLIGLAAIAFTVITAGIGLIQARYAAESIIYGNLVNSTTFQKDRFRIGQQSNLFIPLGTFLVTIGLAMLFSIALRFGYALLAVDSKLVDVVDFKSGKRLSRRPLVRFLGPKKMALIIVGGILVMAGVWVVSRGVYETIFTWLTAFSEHPTFVLGFGVLSFFFAIALYIRRQRMREVMSK